MIFLNAYAREPCLDLAGQAADRPVTTNRRPSVLIFGSLRPSLILFLPLRLWSSHLREEYATAISILSTDGVPRMIMTLKDITNTCKISESTVRRLVAAGEMPASINLGCRRVGWRADQICEWVLSRSPTNHDEEPTEAEWLARLNVLMQSLISTKNSQPTD